MRYILKNMGNNLPTFKSPPPPPIPQRSTLLSKSKERVMFYELQFIKKGGNIFVDDLALVQKSEIINLSLVLSLSLEDFVLSFTGSFISKYGLLTMNNGDLYYISEKTFDSLKVLLLGLKF